MRQAMVAVALLVALVPAAQAYGTVDSTGTTFGEGGCILSEIDGKPTSFCGSDDTSWTAQCTAYWQSVVAPYLASQAQGYGGGTWGSFCRLAFNGNYANHATLSSRNMVPACPDNATLVNGSCQCNDGFAADPNHVQCVPIIIRRPAHECPICELLAGNPIVPLRGAKKESIDTGLRLGGLSLKLSYDTTGKLPGVRGDGTPAVFPSQVLGALWFSSFHRRVIAQDSGQYVLVQRGEGRALGFAANGSGGFTGPTDSNDRLQAVSGGYRYFNAADGSYEDYNETGSLAAIAWVDGSSLSMVFGGPQTWVTLGTEGSTVGVMGTRQVRFGADTRWIEKTVSGSFSCSNTYFELDPAPGYTKTCQVMLMSSLVGAQDNRGRSISFQYDATQRLTRIDDVGGQSILLGYDPLGNLETVQWQDGSTRRFVYENNALPWAMTGVVDEAAARYASFGYDDQGLAVSTEHAGGVDKYVASYTAIPMSSFSDEYNSVKRVVYRTYSWMAPQGTTLTLPNGSSGWLQATTIDGKTYLAGQSQPAGAGCAASSSAQSYDARGNVVGKDDFNGTRSCLAFDLTRNLETARVEGLAPTVDCASVTPLGAAIPTGARKTSTQWHPDWRLPVKVAAPGRLTTSIYNGQPDPFNGNAIASCAPTNATLPDGKPIAVLCKRVEQSSMDADGRTGFALGNSVAPTVDSTVSLLLHGDGADGSTTLSDSSAVPTTVTAAGGAQVSTLQNQFGGSSIRFNGSSSYVSAQGSSAFNFGAGDFTVEFWLYSDGASVNYQGLVNHDQIGGVRGWLIYTDPAAAGALSAAIWSGSTAYGVQDTVALPLNTWQHVAFVRSGSTLQLYRNGQPAGAPVTVGNAAVGDVPEPASIGALWGVGAPTAGSYFGGYVDELRISKGVARYTGAFTVPTTPFVAETSGGTAGTSGTPPLLQLGVPNRVSTWTYNQSGQVLTSKGPRSAVNATTTSAYYTDTTADHTLGDISSTTNAAGEVTSFDRYDKYGNVLQSTDANGRVTLNTYDARQRLLTSSVGGESTTYTYDAMGQLTKATQVDGSWVGYEYDDAHRQVAVKDHLGNRIDYQLDNSGNKTGENAKDPSGNLKRSMARVMDALGRAQQASGTE